MVEAWKDIKDFEGLYQVSNLGNVRSLDRDVVTKNGKVRHYKGQIMSGRIKKGEYQGYILYDLFKNNKRVTMRAHKLVAEAFIPNPNNHTEINHKDGNKQNNHVDNLEWCSRGENIKHAYDNKLRTPVMKGCEERNKRVSIRVALCDSEFNTIQEFDSIGALASHIGLNRDNISRALRNGNGKTIFKDYYIKYI